MTVSPRGLQISHSIDAKTRCPETPIQRGGAAVCCRIKTFGDGGHRKHQHTHTHTLECDLEMEGGRKKTNLKEMVLVWQTGGKQASNGIVPATQSRALLLLQSIPLLRGKWRFAYLSFPPPSSSPGGVGWDWGVGLPTLKIAFVRTFGKGP